MSTKHPLVRNSVRLHFLILASILITSLSSCDGRSTAEKDLQIFKELEAAAISGDTESQFLLGLALDFGIGIITEDNEKSFYWLQQASNAGDRRADVALGLMYWTGTGIAEPDEEVADQLFVKARCDASDSPIYWYENQAELGNPAAQATLGMLYLEGFCVDENDALGVSYYRQAAEQNIRDAQVSLAYAYEDGEGVNRDLGEAAFWYEIAASKGDRYSQWRLAELYKAGEGIAQNYEKAAEWYEAAAKQGDADAQYELGELYAAGNGVKRDWAEALKWIRLSAENDNLDAHYLLGMAYQNGSEGVSVDLIKAKEHYRYAAERGHIWAQHSLGAYTVTRFQEPENIDGNISLSDEEWAEANYWLSTAANNGLVESQMMLANVSKHTGKWVEAVRWYEMAVQQGNMYAEYELGRIYALGLGVEQDFVKAGKLLLKSAEQGLAKSQATFGLLIKDMAQSQKDYDVALSWFKKAAAQDNPLAQRALGDMYSSGEGVPVNYNEAIVWYKKSALNGTIESQKELGIIYLQMASKDDNMKHAIESYAWLSLSAAGNDAQSIEIRDMLAEEFNSTELAQGQARAMELFEVIQTKTNLNKS